LFSCCSANLTTRKLEEADGIEEIRPEIGPRIASIARG
jgi:hypothetical protein